MKKERQTNSFILITGAAGMIGSGLIRHFNDQGIYNLLLVDDLKQKEKWKNLVGKRFVDLISRHQLFSFLEERGDEIDAIFHLGACSDTTEKDADYLLENNYRYTIRLASWALHHNRRFIYASSAATYGDGSQGFSDDEEGLERLKPLNMYGYSKHLVDLWMKRENVFDRVVALKYFNVFGPNEAHKEKMASMVFKMTHKVRLEGRIGLYKSNDPEQFADGEQCRDFIYLKDAVRMSAAFIDPAYRHLGGVYNIGHGNPTTWNSLAHSLFRALGHPPKIAYIDLPLELSLQYQNYTCAQMDKFFKHLPLKRPLQGIEESVQDYVQNHLLVGVSW